MSDKEVSARPNLQQYRKQAKNLARDCNLRVPDALARLRRHHPRFHRLAESELQQSPVALSDAQLVVAREHGFESWPKFAKYIERMNLIASVGTLTDPVAAFIEVACVPRHTGHGSGTLEHAGAILARYPQVATANIHTAAILADEPTVRGFLARDPASASATGDPHGWDTLTHLCFSRYLHLDRSRSEAFVRTARALLDAGASAKTGWYEMIDHPTPRPLFESAIYGAAGIAQHAELTRLLLDYGADPNDEETPYHVPEGYDNTVMKILLESGRLNKSSLTTMLLRKTDWHDEKGLQMVLERGGDPNDMPRFGDTGLQHALRRDNGLLIIELLLDHGANPALRSIHDGRSATEIAARRGRGDVLALLEARGMPFGLQGVNRLIAACARGDCEGAASLAAQEPALRDEFIAQGGALLAEFAGNDNVEGIRCLLNLGVAVDALYGGDPYFEIARGSTALHVAAWRASHAAVCFLIERGSAVGAVDARGQTPLKLAVRACVDSYWKYRRKPDSIEALLRAGATTAGIEIPCGYDEVDVLLREHVR